MTGCVLLVLAQIANAQTLADVQGLMKQGKMPQALEQAERYIAAQPEDAFGPFTKGLILTEMGRPQEAIEVFAGLTEKFPELPEPYNNLAVLYARQKQYDKARTALERAIHTHPAYAIAHENLGDIYAKLASLAYDKALQLDSSNRTTQTKLSMIKELISAPAKVAAAETAKPPAPVTTVATAAKPPAASPKPVAVAPVPPVASVAPARTAATSSGEKGKSTAGNAAQENEIAQIIRDWAAAWSRKDVPAYLAFYASDFQAPNGMARKKWETERRQRIDKPGTLQIGVTDIKVSVSSDRATARFRQNYVSATLKSQTSKTLVFVKSGNGWRILIERVG
jgi:tetratricopeptide (TPR) repeat protein